MGSIMWNENKIMDFSDNYKEHLVAYCNSERIKFTTDDKDIILFPRLSEKTLILKSITSNKEERELIESIKNMLINEGAIVISDKDFMDKTSLKYLDTQILIVISFGSSYKDLTVYIPSDISNTNILVAKQFFKQLILSNKTITYNIANNWDKLKRIKYWTYLFNNSTSTLIFEISKSDLYKDFLRDFGYVLSKSIIEELGDKPSNEKAEELIHKLKCYKKQLDEELENANNDIDNEVIEEFNNTKIDEELENANNDIDNEVIEEFNNTKLDEELENSNNDIDNEIIEELENKNEKSTENKEKNFTDNKNEEVKKDKAVKTKMVYLPNIPIDNAGQGVVNQQISYPIMYPGECAVYEFQRPKPDDKKPEVT